MNHVPSMRAALAAVVLPLLVVAGCADDDATDVSAVPWRTAVDSTGDTVIVRISGDVPAAHVRTLVLEARAGAEDGTEEETFGALSEVVPTASNGFVVFDQQAVAMRLFDSTGAFVRALGRRGGGPGEHEHVNGIVTLRDGRLVAWDAAGARLNLYTAAGDFLRIIPMPVRGSFSSEGLSVDKSDLLYADAVVWRDSADRRNTRRGVVRLDTTGRVIDSIAYPRSGRVAAVARATSADGGMSTTYGIPYQPADETDVLPNGAFVHGAGDPYEFTIGSPAGSRARRIVREHRPVPVAATERAEQTAMIEQVMKRTNPAWTWTGPTIPDHKAAYRQLAGGRDGTVWVQLSVAAEVIPEAERGPVPVGQGAQVEFTTREPSVYDVYSPDGALLGRVAVPAKLQLTAMTRTHVWGIQRDSLDVPYAVRMRVSPALPSTP